MIIPGYEIYGKIGEGGMASVFKGRQLSLKRDVAIKTLSKELLNQQGFYERFDRESLIIARLSNPYIIPIIERGITEDKIPYFIMEFVEGTDLKIAMRENRLDFNQKLDICLQIAKALSYAHKNGVIHRDIKPANILIDHDGNAKVMDFGIAQYSSKDIDAQNTGKGDKMGTLAYMSPEQHQSASLVTFKSDLYSFGVLMYKLFTNSDPIGRFQTPCEIDHKIPKTLDELIISCLENEPDNRPASAEAIKNTLLQALGGAHLGTQQKLRTNVGIKNLELLDVLKEEGQMSVSLYINKTNNSMLVLNKRPINYPGLTESKLLTNLKHKNIANILGTSKNDKFYIVVTAYNNGGELRERMLNPMELKQFIPIALDIVSALSFAHKNRIVHGHIRPSTILFDENDQIKLTDFGFRLPDHTKKVESRYQQGNEPPSIQADIYALGVLFYKMLCGNFPVLASDQFTQEEHFKQLPFKLRESMTSMLKKNLQDRASSCSPIETVLQELLAAERRKDEEPTLIYPTAAPESKKLSTLTIVSLVLSSLLTIFACLYFFNDKVNSQIKSLFEKHQSTPKSSEVQPEEVPNFIQL